MKVWIVMKFEGIKLKIYTINLSDWPYLTAKLDGGRSVFYAVGSTPTLDKYVSDEYRYLSSLGVIKYKYVCTKKYLCILSVLVPFTSFTQNGMLNIFDFSYSPTDGIIFHVAKLITTYRTHLYSVHGVYRDSVSIEFLCCSVNSRCNRFSIQQFHPSNPIIILFLLWRVIVLFPIFLNKTEQKFSSNKS